MTMLGGDTYTITMHDPANDSDEEIAERVAYGNEHMREAFPDDPPARVEDAIARERAVPTRMRRWSFRARDADGRLVGAASSGYDPEHDDNPDVLQGGVSVLPAHRRRGLGARLLAELVRLAREQGRTRILGETFERVPAGARFAAAIGAECKLESHLNHLVTADVDRALLNGWVADGPVRASGYELVWWDDRVPDEELEPYVRLVLVMNSAPLDDLQINDFTYTAEQLREDEGRMHAAGQVRWLAVVRRVSDGALAGFHDVYWHESSPQLVWVGATGVEPEHRGHALGKWLKAAMTLRVLDERPDVTEIRTGNADSNDAMLGINRAMGYRPMMSMSACELSIDRAAAWLTERGLLTAS